MTTWAIGDTARCIRDDWSAEARDLQVRLPFSGEQLRVRYVGVGEQFLFFDGWDNIGFAADRFERVQP